MKKLTYLFSWLLLSFCCLVAQANTDKSNAKWYKISVIGFKQTNIEQLQPERIATPFTANMWKNTVQLKKLDLIADGPPGATDFQLLPTEQSALQQEVKRLQSSGQYQILLNATWLQSFTPRQQAVTIHLYGGQPLNYLGKPVIVTEADEPTETPNTSAEAKNEKDNNKLEEEAKPIDYSQVITNYELNGTMKIYIKRYFNVAFNLHLNEPLSNREATDISQPMKIFSMQQNRRMRSEELNYFDHPAFGVIVKIVRIKLNNITPHLTP